MHRVGSEALLDPCYLTDKSTKKSVLRLKCIAFVCHLIWKQLEGQNQQSNQELKRTCFQEVAGQSVNNLLNVASRFSDARWPADRIKHMFLIFDTLVEALDCMKEIPLIRSDTIQNKVAVICGNIIRNMGLIVGEIACDGRISKESAIHPATNYYLQALKCFHDMKDKLQAVLGSGDYANDLHSRWVSKLVNVAVRLFENRKDQQYIFILNNALFVSQRGSDPNMSIYIEQIERKVDSLIQEYIKKYLDEFWLPLLTCASMDRFTRKFEAICSDSTRILKVRPVLREKLVKEIMDLGLGPDGIFSRFPTNELQPGRSSAFRFCFWRKQKSMTVMDFKNMVTALFER